jgi:DinB family protein
MTVSQLQILPLEGYDPEIGCWLWALQDVRRRYTLRLVKDLDERLVDWEGPDGRENAIGSLLYHIAHVEMDWLFRDVHGMIELPPAIKPDFPFPSREPDRNHLTRVLGLPLTEHVARLERSRVVFLKELQGISPEEWRRLRRPPDFEEVNYEVTPEWMVFHLVEHEAGHAFQISSLKARGMRMLVANGPEETT